MSDIRPAPNAPACLGVSVIVCCHNSASRLPATLAHLARQNIPPPAPWEVVVVDNGSTDGTADGAERIWRELGASADLRVVVEPTIGLSHARQCGVAAARYGILVFVDDDNWLDEDYLTIVTEVISQHPQIGVLGGAITAAFEHPPPPWFARVQSWFAVGPQGDAAGDITSYKRHVAGAGMALRRSVYEELRGRGFRFLLADRTAGALTSGGDTELCLALVLLGYRIWYDDRLHLVHFMPRARLTRSYLFRLLRTADESAPVIACYESVIRESSDSALRVYSRSVLQRCVWALKAFARLVLGRADITICQAECAALWRNVIALPEWSRAFKQYHPRLMALRNGARK